jgi:putative transposase
MPRTARNIVTGRIYHLMNHAKEGLLLFEQGADLQIGERILLAKKSEHAVRLYAFCLLPSRWDLVAAELAPGALRRFVSAFTRTHAATVRDRRFAGGSVYGGRFRSMPLGAEDEVLRAIRYVERSAQSEGMVDVPEAWAHSSLHHRLRATELAAALLDPLPLPANWPAHVCAPIKDQDVREITRGLHSGRLTPRRALIGGGRSC